MVKNLRGLITHAIQGGRMRAPLVVLLSLAIITGGVFIYNSITAVGTIVPASGGTNVSLDTTSAPGGSGAYASLGGISIPEAAPGEIKLGVYTFNLPAGWEFDTLSPVTVSSNGTYMRWWPINPAPNAASFSFEIERSSVTTAETILLSGLRVRPTGITPLSAANIYMTCVNTIGTCGITAVTAGSDGTNFGTLSSVAGVAVRLSVTGTATQTAGAGNELTITAYDQFGNVATGYTGSKSLTFSGLNNSPDGNVPKVETVNFGTPVSVTFTSGVSNANAATLIAYKVESGSVNVTDGTINSMGDAAYDLDLTVNPATAGRLEMTAVAGTMDAGASNELTITAKDAFGNVDTNYDGAKDLTFSGIGNSPSGSVPTVETNVISAPVSITFSDGVTDGTNATLVAYKAEGPVELEVSAGTIDSTVDPAYDVDLTVKHLAADHLKFSTNVSSPQTAGAQFALPALNAVDIYGNVADGANGATAYTVVGDTVAYTLSGSAGAPNGIPAADSYTASVDFTNGVSTTALNTTLYRAQDTTVTANGPLTGTDEASNSFTVSAAAASAVNITTQPVNSGDTVDNPLTTQPAISVTDAYGNANSSGQGVTATLDTGTGTLIYDPVDTVNGIGTFTNLQYNKSGETFSMHFTVNSIDSAVSNPVVDALNPGAIVNYTVVASTPQTAGTPFNTTVTAYDQYNNVVNNDNSTVVTMTSSGQAAFDSDGNATFDDNTKTLSSGTFTISTKDTKAETMTVTATDGNGKTGTTASVVVDPAVASKVIVETANDGTGTVVGAQTLAPLQTLTVYAISRDAFDNFIANVDADTWAVTGGIGNLSAPNGLTTTFTAITGGTGVIQVTEVGLTPTNSGTITVETLTEIYVDPAGNDSNPGTSGSPKLTIQNAVNAVADSGTVNVDAGTYAESVTVNKAVTIQKKSGAVTTPVVTANDSWGFKLTAANITIDGLNIQITGGTSTNDQAIRLENADNIVIQNNTITTTGDTALGIWTCGTESGCTSSDNVNINNNTITINGVATGIYVEQVTVAHTGWSITDNTITADAGVTIELYDVTASTVTSNILDGSTTNSNIIWSSQRGNISNLTFTNNTVSDSSGSMVAFLSDFSNLGDGLDNTSVTTVTVTGNTFNTWGSRGLRVGTEVTGVTVSTNNFTGGTGEAAKNESGTPVTASGNTWSDFATNPGYPTAYDIFVSVGVYTGGTDSSPVGELDASATLVDVSSASITVSNGGNTSTITITAKGNNSGNLLSGIDPSLIVITSVNASSTISAPIVDAGSGTYTATIFSPLAGVDTISATIDGVPITDTAGVTYVPDALDHIIFTAEPATGGEAGTNFAVQPVVTLYDQFNNILTTDDASTVTLSAVLVSDGSPAAGTLNATTNPLTVTDGVATFSGVNYTGVDNIQLKAVTGAEEVLTGAIQNNPGNLESFSLINFGTLTAGTATTTAITAKDPYGNATTKDTDGSTLAVNESVTFSSTAIVAPDGTQPTYGGADLTDGETASVDLSSGTFTSANVIFYKASEAPTLTVALNGKSGTATSVGVNSASISALSITGDSPVTTAQTSTITVTGKDQYQNPVTDNGVVVTLSAGGGANLASGGGTLTVGVFTTTLTKDTPGSSTVSASSGSLTPGNVTIVFTDGSAPTVTNWTPADGTTGVALTVNPTLVFSEYIASTTVNTTNIKLKKYIGGSDITITLSPSALDSNNNPQQIVLIPSAPLNYGTQYYIYQSGLTDINGNALAAWDDSVSSKDSHEFTTEAAETTPPTVASYSPIGGTTNVAVSVGQSPSYNLWIKFSEEVDPTSIDSSSVQLRYYSAGTGWSADDAVTGITRVLSEGNTKVMLQMASPLSYGTQYYFYIGTGVEDVVGNPFTGNTWQQGQKAQHEFTTIPGMSVQVYAEKTDASIDNTYLNGWRYRYEMTLNTTETKLQVQFPTGWTSTTDNIPTADNMRMLVNEGTVGQITGLWSEGLITGGDGVNIKSYALNTTYAGQLPLTANIGVLDSNPTLAGRQIVFYVFTKIPLLTDPGIYTADYGIQTGN